MFSDCQGLVSFLADDMEKIKNARARAMVEEIQMFPIDVLHVPGAKMELLDHGSRYPISIGQHKEFEAEAGTLGICHRSNRVSPMESCDVKDLKVELLAAMALQDEDYRKDVGGQFMELYDVIAEHLNASEDYFMFYTNIYSFVDSALRELMRNKVVNNLFRNDIKSDIIDQSSNKKMKDVKPSGILGG